LNKALWKIKKTLGLIKALGKVKETLGLSKALGEDLSKVMTRLSKSLGRS